VILLLFLLAAAALTEGLRLPAITITRAGLFDSQYSILAGLADLADGGHYGVFAFILVFSVVLPYVKLLLLAWLFLSSGPAERRRRLLSSLAAVGKWSLLDVLVVSLIVFSLQGGFFVSSQLEPGLYLFASAVILSMMLTGWIARLAARP
jgi:paraquat-inducible protein A